MFNKVDMPTWIWESDKENSRLSTYEFYTFMSFTDVDGNDFISIVGRNLSEYLALTIIHEPVESIDSFTQTGWRWKLICVGGCQNLITFAKVIANKSCQLMQETDNSATFIAPTATIIESVVTDIIMYLKNHHITLNKDEERRVREFEAKHSDCV